MEQEHCFGLTCEVEAGEKEKVDGSSETARSVSGRPLTRTEIGLTKDVSEMVERWLGCGEFSTDGKERGQRAPELMVVHVELVAFAFRRLIKGLAVKNGNEVSPDESASQVGEENMEEQTDDGDDERDLSEDSGSDNSDSEVSSGISR